MVIRLVILVIWLASVQKCARDKSANAKATPVYEVIHSTNKIDWDRCPSLGPLAAPWSADIDSTIFRAFYTDQHFIFRFDVRDSDIVDNGNGEQSVAAGDRVELFFSKSSSLADSYYCIEVSPAGRVLDYAAKYHRQFDDSWNMDSLKVNSKTLPGGYVVEGRIPLRFFHNLTSSNNLKGQQVFVGVFRAEISRQNMPDAFTWFSWLRPESVAPDFHIPSSFGIFKF